MSGVRDWQRVDELFHRALERAPSERDAFLDAACGGDTALRAEVASLLAADERAPDDVFDRVTAGMAAHWIAEHESSLPPGRTLGRYRITGCVGAGGMGEVYSALDTSLHRPVALKVLPRRFFADAERVRRFEEEARAASALNHPNIVTIHEIGRSNGSEFIVSELVEGETLRQRIARGPLPLQVLLDIGIQTATALSAAHAAGIVHRDIKADNLMVRPDGIVKVLDFGLAKLTEEAKGDLAEPVQSRVETATGTVMGTVCYMSPEQALGDAIDQRSDVFSLGVVLYEMATGRRPFDGNTDAAVYDALLNKTPAPVIAASPGLPPELDRIIGRAMERDRELRYQTASDLAAELKKLSRESTGPGSGSRHRVVRSGVDRRAAGRTRRAGWWAVAAAAGALGVSALWMVWTGNESVSPHRPVRRFVLTLPAIIEPEQVPGATAVISPNGRHIVYVRGPAARRSLYIRDLDRLDDRPLAGTEMGHTPFFSPDSEWVAFVARGELRKVRVAGGAPYRLADVPSQRGGSWGPDDRIVIATSDGRLQRLSADGGALDVIATPDPGRSELSYRWPEVLPDGRAVTFTVIEGADGTPTGGVHLQALRLDTAATQQTLVAGASYGRYAASGHLLYYRADALEAVPFDARRLEVIGPAVSLADRVVGMPAAASPEGGANFSIAADGTLIYIPGVTGPIERETFRVDRSGNERPVPQPRRALVDPNVAPDGRRLALVASGALFVVNMATGEWKQITPQSEFCMAPVWTRDQTHLVYARRTTARAGLFRRAADGAGAEEPVWSDPSASLFPMSFSPDDRVLAVMRMAADSATWDIWLLHLGPKGVEARPLLTSDASERHPQFSPDGRWLAFVSDQSGRDEVYVQRYPTPAGTLEMSVDGGTEPRWSRDGRTLFYREGDRLMEVQAPASSRTRATVPRLVFEGAYQDVGVVIDYDVAPDGHFVMIKASERDAGYMHLNVILNAFEELGRLAPHVSGRR